MKTRELDQSELAELLLRFRSTGDRASGESLLEDIRWRLYRGLELPGLLVEWLLDALEVELKTDNVTDLPRFKNLLFDLDCGNLVPKDDRHSQDCCLLADELGRVNLRKRREEQHYEHRWHAAILFQVRKNSGVRERGDRKEWVVERVPRIQSASAVERAYRRYLEQIELFERLHGPLLVETTEDDAEKMWRIVQLMEHGRRDSDLLEVGMKLEDLDDDEIQEILGLEKLTYRQLRIATHNLPFSSALDFYLARLVAGSRDFSN